MLPGRGFSLGCALAAAGLFLLSAASRPLPLSLLAAEVCRHHPRPLPLRIVQVSDPQERPDLRDAAGHHRDVRRSADLRLASGDRGSTDGGPGLSTHLLSFHGLDDLIHADTMLFILGLTFFVSVIAQTRLLEGITFVAAPPQPRADPARPSSRSRPSSPSRPASSTASR